MVSRVTRGHGNNRQYRTPALRVERELTRYITVNNDAEMRIVINRLTYLLKSARLITGTQTLKCIYRLEGSGNAPRK